MTVGMRKRGNAAAETKKARKAGAFIRYEFGSE